MMYIYIIYIIYIILYYIILYYIILYYIIYTNDIYEDYSKETTEIRNKNNETVKKPEVRLCMLIKYITVSLQIGSSSKNKMRSNSHYTSFVHF